jgi:hypothetical protein
MNAKLRGLLGQDELEEEFKKRLFAEVTSAAANWPDLDHLDRARKLESWANRAVNLTDAERESLTSIISAQRLCPRDRFGALINLAKIARRHEQEPEEKKVSTATMLVQMALEGGVELWHSPGPDGEAFATLPNGLHVGVMSSMSRSWLRQRFYETTGASPHREALLQACEQLEARALFRGEEHEAHVRVAGVGGEALEAVWVDLGDSTSRAVEITQRGWTLVDKPRGVFFLRKRGMRPLPVPEAAGPDENPLGWFRHTFHLDEAQYVLLCGFLVSTLHPHHPFPILEITGEQGSGKSLLTRLLRELIDPNEAPLRSPPKDERDLAIWAKNGWLSCITNVSAIPPWMSDALCRLATDGGLSTRELYSNDREMIFKERRPLVINGIGGPVQSSGRGDLVDRAICLVLRPIPPDQRRPEQELLAEFEEVRPKMLGQLYSAVSRALRGVGRVRLKECPRLADVALWVTAGEAALGLEEGAFVSALMNQKREARSQMLQEDPLGSVLLAWAKALSEDGWTGSAGDLLAELERRLDGNRPPRHWPESPRALGRKLSRLAPLLRDQGFDIELSRTGTQRRWVVTRQDGENNVTNVTKRHPLDFIEDSAVTFSHPHNVTPELTSLKTSQRKNSDFNELGVCDVSDVKSRPLSDDDTEDEVPTTEGGVPDDADPGYSQALLQDEPPPEASESDDGSAEEDASPRTCGRCKFFRFDYGTHGICQHWVAFREISHPAVRCQDFAPSGPVEPLSEPEEALHRGKEVTV